MAKTPSIMPALGGKAPYFSLPDVISGEIIKLDAIMKYKQGLLVMFICNHCPFVVHVKDELVNIGNDYVSDLAIVAISSNDVEQYPEDAPDKMREFADINKFPFPYLYDASQEVAKAFQAACTPDFFLYDQDLKLVYRGQLDDARPGNQERVSGNDLRNAIDALLGGTPLSDNQKPSLGCNIKWKDCVL
jgi:peroxiredoxin